MVMKLRTKGLENSILRQNTDKCLRTWYGNYVFKKIQCSALFFFSFENIVFGSSKFVS